VSQKNSPKRGGKRGGKQGGASLKVAAMSTPRGGEIPPFALLTIVEAARVLRIGRSKAYQLAKLYLTSGGAAGMPVVDLDGCLRVPRWALLELALTGRVMRVCDAPLPELIGDAEPSPVPDDV